MRDASELRVKETDRIATIAENFKRMGLAIELREDGFEVPGRQQFHAAELDSFGDHRIAMAFSIAALAADGPCTILGAGCSLRVFPGIFRYTTASRRVIRMAVADLTLEGLVHDLNNVFQTIAESAELLEDDPKWEKLAHTLQRSAGRGHRIAHSILETNRSAIELAPIIENASQFCQDYLECANRTENRFLLRDRR